jgi:hypothetical protein
MFAGNHTIAVIKGHESYEVLQSACATVFGQVNKLVEEGKISCIDGKEVPVVLHLGGDYKLSYALQIVCNNFHNPIMHLYVNIEV